MQHLGSALGITGQVVRAFVDRRLADHAATFPEFHLLHVLHEHGRVTMGELARHLDLEVSTVTHHVKHYEAEGKVRRLPSPTDRRSVLVALTPAGRRRLQRLRALMEGLDAEVRALLTEAEVTRLLRLLGKLQSGLARLGASGR